MDSGANEVWFVVPAFQEEVSIANSVSEIVQAGYCVVVIDDGSADRTSQRALEAGAIVLRHAANLGQGAAIQTGMTFALRQRAKVLVTFDADGQHSLSDALAMLHYAQTQQVDVVFGSRFLRQSDMRQIPKARRFILKLATRMAQLTSRPRLTDSHCGLRIISRSAAQVVHINHNRMAHASEIPIKVARAGLRYAEFPVSVRYTEYSKIKGQRNSGAFLILWDLATGGIRK